MLCQRYLCQVSIRLMLDPSVIQGSATWSTPITILCSHPCDSSWHLSPFLRVYSMTDMGVLRVIVHFDCDAFYAQCEEVRDPSLKSRPLGKLQTEEMASIRDTMLCSHMCTADCNDERVQRYLWMSSPSSSCALSMRGCLSWMKREYLEG